MYVNVISFVMIVVCKYVQSERNKKWRDRPVKDQTCAHG